MGVVNDVIITGLRLQSGHTYFATVRGSTNTSPFVHVSNDIFFSSAHDFAGQWSEVTSPGVTVDLTPPTGPTHFTLVNTDSAYSSVPLAVDAESGVAETAIALGSRPGSSDLLEWTPASYGNGMETYIQQAGIEDGQLVFASVQVSLFTHFLEFQYSVPHVRYGMEPALATCSSLLGTPMTPPLLCRAPCTILSHHMTCHVTKATPPPSRYSLGDGLSGVTHILQ